MNAKRLNKLYEKKKIQHPEADAETIELLVRKHIFRTRISLCILLYVFATLCTIVYSNDSFTKLAESNEVIGNISILLLGIGGFGSIGAVCLFAKTVHDPLTPNESKELAKKDAYEKTGEE